MAKFLHYQQCPKCMERGRDSRGDNCATYSDGGMHCFSCGYHVFPKHYIQPTHKAEKINAAVLPTDFSREVPSHALKWLLQYGLPFSYWRPFIGWTEKDSRLVFTVGEGPMFSIGRYIPDGSDRPPQRKWYVWGESHKQAHVIGDYTTAKQVVLVEDLISAHKLSSITTCIPLFGTNIFPAVVPCARHIALPLVIWLDKDQEGTLQKKANWLQVMTGLPVRYVCTKDDPKCLSMEKINEALRTE